MNLADLGSIPSELKCEIKLKLTLDENTIYLMAQ